jgi:SAM-dependent methyltransferase
MLTTEAEWIGSLIPILRDKNAFPLLNIGSSTLQFRKYQQPHIEKYIFDPLNKIGAKVLHLDLKANEGVDIVGSLDDNKIISDLIKFKFKSIICSNLLEHVENPKILCQTMYEILQPKGLLIVTVPFLFPYHNDPIDTLFRPTVYELASLFPHMKPLLTIKIESDKTYFSGLLQNKKELEIILIRFLTPFYKPKNWLHLMKYLPNFFKKTSVSCVVLEKIS